MNESRKIEKISAEGLQQVFRVTFDADTVNSAILSQTKERAKHFKMNGFRPGHAPMSIVKKHYAERITKDALEGLVSNAAQAVIQNSGITELATRPTYKLDAPIAEDTPLQMTLTVESVPQFELRPLDFELTRVIPNVQDEAVQNDLTEMIEKIPVYEEAPNDHLAAATDKVYIEYSRFAKGAANKTRKSKTSLVIPENTPENDKLIPALLEKRAKDTFDVQLDDRDRLHIVVDKIETRIKNVSEEEFAKKLGFDDLAALRNSIRKRIENEIEAQAYLYHKSQIAEYLTDIYEFDLPQTVLKQESQAILAQIKYEREKAKQNGESIDEKSDEELLEEYDDTIKKRVILGYVFNKIAAQQGLVVTDSEVNRSILAEVNADPAHAVQIIEYYKNNPGAITYRKAEITERKIVNYIVSTVKNKEEPKTLAEIQEIVREILEDDDAIEDSAKKDAKPEQEVAGQDEAKGQE